MLKKKLLTKQEAILLFCKWFFVSFFSIIAIIIVFVFWSYKFQKEEKRQNCRPQFLEYSLGDIDPRFNLKNEEILAVLKDSEGIWEEPLGYDVLRYNPDATFKINFVFDERQEYVQNTKEIVEEYGKLEQEYSRLENVINPTKKIKQEKNVLAEKERILTDKLSIEEEKFENGGGETFEQGAYFGNSIDIYTFRYKKELEAIATHEFGHWLGLDDKKDPSSIMNWKGSDDYIQQVTEGDLREVKDFCVNSGL